MTHPLSDTVPLGMLSMGDKARVVAIEVKPEDAQGISTHLRNLGFDEGLDIELLHQSPFGGDPVAVRIGPMTVALRRSEANLVKVTRL